MAFVYVLGRARANHHPKPRRKPLPFAETCNVSLHSHVRVMLAYQITDYPSVQPGHHHAQHCPEDEEERVQKQHECLLSRFTTCHQLPTASQDGDELTWGKRF